MIKDTWNTGVSRQRTFLNTVLVYILIFTSGSLRYLQSDDKYLVLSFIVALLVWIVYTDRKISSSFILYIISFSGFLYALSVYTGGSLSLASVIASTMKFILAYLVVRTVNERFTVTFVEVIVFLAVVSLVGYLSDTLHLFDEMVSKLPIIPDRGYDGVFYIFRDTFHPYRNQSIFFEPGAYQAFLNAALFIIFFTNFDVGRRRQWVYIIVLIAALVTTYSTTGFIIFLCGFSLFLYKSDIVSFNGKIILLGAIIVVVSVFSTQFYSTFIVKINDYLTADEYDFAGSAQTRSSQLKADIGIIKRHVFGLGHKKYKEEFKIEGRIEGMTSSNGVTVILAMYGLPFGLFIFGSYYLALRRLLQDYILATGAFIMFLLFLAGESYYINTPISYLIIAAAFVIYHDFSRKELFEETM